MDDDKLYNEEIKERKYKSFKEVMEEKKNPPKEENTNFVMVESKEPEQEKKAEKKEEKTLYTETHKSPKKNKGGFGRLVAALLIVSIFGGGSIGAGYGAVKFIAEEKYKTEENTSQPATNATAVVASVKNDDAAAVIDSVFPAVVNISIVGTASQSYYGFTIPYEYESAGSGIVFSEDDEKVYIATNNHVIDGAGSISVSVEEADGVAATVVGKDSSSDLAVISVLKADLEKQGIANVTVASFGDSDSLRVGQSVIAIGNALGEGKIATGGMISSKEKTITVDSNALTVIQTDTAINPGNSGGALVDYTGNVIGINTAKTSSTDVEGVGYAIPSSTALPILEELLENGTIPKPYLGIVGMDVTEELSKTFGLPVGAYVTQVLSNSGAAEAGLQEGDIITDLAGVKIMNMNKLIETVSSLNVGDTVDIRYIRNGKDVVEGKVTIYNANNL